MTRRQWATLFWMLVMFGGSAAIVIGGLYWVWTVLS